MRVEAVRYARKRLDLSLADVAYGLTACLRPPPPAAVTARLAAAWDPSESVVACLSARSGFDLLLAAVDWPPGSEVILSAITIPHMAALVRHHGYVPVAVDVDPATMELDPEEVRTARTPRTRALVFAHLFGTHADVTALAELARTSGLLFVEDRAQCYDGVDRALGLADVALYSFGTIKTATCLGGGVALVRDPGLRAEMRARQRAYPVQSARGYAQGLGKGAVLLGLGRPGVYRQFTRALQVVLGDFDAVVRSVSRGFEDRTLLSRIRRRPSPALLAMMARRVPGYHAARVAARRDAGDYLASLLVDPVDHLGRAGRAHTHWLFPVASRAPATLVAAGREAGFDLTSGSSTLVTLDEACVRAGRAMRDVVYLPVDGRTPRPALAALAAVVNAVERDRAPEGEDAGAGEGARASARRAAYAALGPLRRAVGRR